MHSLSALEWHVNLYDMFGISQTKFFFCVGACTTDNVSGHASLNSRHDIFLRFYFLDSKSSTIDKYAFYCRLLRLLNRRIISRVPDLHKIDLMQFKYKLFRLTSRIQNGGYIQFTCG